MSTDIRELSEKVRGILEDTKAEPNRIRRERTARDAVFAHYADREPSAQAAVLRTLVQSGNFGFLEEDEILFCLDIELQTFETKLKDDEVVRDLHKVGLEIERRRLTLMRREVEALEQIASALNDELRLGSLQ